MWFPPHTLSPHDQLQCIYSVTPHTSRKCVTVTLPLPEIPDDNCLSQKYREYWRQAIRQRKLSLVLSPRAELSMEISIAALDAYRSFIHAFYILSVVYVYVIVV